jgi:CheY-like chemotaxis protein
VTLETLGALLRAQGFQVLTAMDAMQAFMIAQRTQPDVVLLDIQMPGGTGLETLKRLGTSSKTQSIPVIVISVLADARRKQEVMALGARALFAKPVDFAALQQSLAELLA